jgi:creatinine amidohydrolase
MKAEFAANAWPGVRDALQSGKKIVAILPCGATEAHGPHLPLNTDVIISETMAAYALPGLAARGILSTILPPLAYMPANMRRRFPAPSACAPRPPRRCCSTLRRA